jgi:hypothetical protein
MVTRKAKPKRESRDINELAFDIVAELTSDMPPQIEDEPVKDPAAVARGRKGGLVGGNARAAKLPAKKRKAIAKKAAKARWEKL